MMMRTTLIPKMKIKLIKIKKINLIQLRIVLIIFYSSFFCENLAFASPQMYYLSAEQWAVPRSVTAIISMHAIASVMQALQDDKNSSLVIHYPGGDEGSLWATELRGWLISLGLSSSKITLVPGSTAANRLDLEITVNTR